MYEEDLRLIDQINLSRQGGTEYKLSANLTTVDIKDICELVTTHNPRNPEGFKFWYQVLSVEQLTKLYLFLNRCKDAHEIDLPFIQLAATLTLGLLREVLTIPCEIEVLSRDVGYFEAVEDILTHYVPIEEYEKAHEKTHIVLDVIDSAESLGGWVRKLHQN